LSRAKQSLPKISTKFQTIKIIAVTVNVAKNNRKLFGKLNDVKEELKRTKVNSKKCADDLKEAKKEKGEFKKEKKQLMDSVSALNKATQAQDAQNTIDRDAKTIDTLEKHMINKKGGGTKDDDLEEELKKPKARSDAKLEADLTKRCMCMEVNTLSPLT
jgi:uncharacterized phage infection (PIP) family protein YhgE